MFFQAEDGRRDIGVTGVQTCALPIYVSLKVESGQFAALVGPTGAGKSTLLGLIARLYHPLPGAGKIDEIGRASGRERVEISVVAGSLNEKRTRETPTGAAVHKRDILA